MRDVLETADWPRELDRVCTPGGIAPLFQPIVDLQRGVACGYEALARFVSPLRAAPPAWFAAAALYGVTGRLEAAVLRSVLRRRADVPPNCFLTVNLSPTAAVAEEVIAVLEAEGDLRGLVVEITEQAPVDDYDRLTGVLRELRQAGAMVAVDDTGAGYASLRHLLVLEPDFVKLDRSLVAGVDRDPRLAAVVDAIGAFAGRLDAWLVVEGIERLGELDRVIGLGVPLAQGYLLGRPSRSMPELAPDLRARIGGQARRAATPVVGGLIRRVGTRTAGEDRPCGDGPLVLVDRRHRPLRVEPGDGGAGHAPMCVQASDAVADVALRAIARDLADRYAPVCVCDELGRLLGIVTVDRLTEALAQARTA